MCIVSYWRTDFLFGQTGTQETLGPMDKDKYSKENFNPKGGKKDGTIWAIQVAVLHEQTATTITILIL